MSKWAERLSNLPEATLLLISETSLHTAQAIRRFRDRTAIENADPYEVERVASLHQPRDKTAFNMEDYMAPERGVFNDMAPAGPPEA
jgi:hypothetical protein